MSEVVKIKETELAELNMFNQKFQELIIKLGNLQVEKMELDRYVSEFIDKEKKCKDEWVSLQKLEQDLLDKIIKNYGEGSLNLSNGTFIKDSIVPPQPTAPLP